MSISSPLQLAIPLLGLVLIYKFLIYPAFLSPLSRIPSAHPTAPFSQVWSLYIRFTNVENATLLQLHRAKGPIIRLGPNEISVNCYEEGLKTVYGGNFDKTEFYPNRFANYGGVTNMLSIMGSKEHAARKRMLSSIYSKSQIMTSPTARSSLTTIIYDRFLPLFQSSSETGKPIDILSLSYAFSIDSFMSFQFGLALGSNFIQDVEQREWYMRNFLGRRPYLFWTIEMPRLYAFLQKCGVQLIPAWFFQGIREIEGWNLKICDAAEKVLESDSTMEMSVENQPAVFSTMRSAMLKADLKSEKDNASRSDAQNYPNRFALASEMLDHNAASLETSGVILTYIFYELSLRPEMQSQLRDELCTLSEPIAYPGTTLPGPKPLDALPLLDAIIQETLRLYAPAPGPQPRVTPFPSCRLAGIDGIPGGVRVSANGWCLHRNEDVFPDCEKWMPERWMVADEKKVAEMKKWMWAFSSGGRMCIGSHFAMNSMKNAVGGVYTNFRSEAVDRKDMEQTDGYTTGPIASKVFLKFHKV